MPLRRLYSMHARARKLARILRVGSFRRALRHGVGASVEHNGLPLPDRVSTVIDVGANRGQFAVFAAHRWPDATLICFEPLPGPRATLERLMVDHPRARISGIALSDSAGHCQMHISRADDSSSLLPITERQTAAFPRTEEVSLLDVQTSRLDTQLPPGSFERPVILKIDVQGAELSVLRGAAGLLPDCAAVMVECSFLELYGGQALIDDVIRFLHRHGLALTAMASPSLDPHGNVLQADLVFTSVHRTDGPVQSHRR